MTNINIGKYVISLIQIYYIQACISVGIYFWEGQDATMYVQNQDMYVQNQDMYVQNQDMYVQNQDMYVQNQAFFLRKCSVLRISGQ